MERKVGWLERHIWMVVGFDDGWYDRFCCFSGWWLPENGKYGVGEEKRERKKRAGAATAVIFGVVGDGDFLLVGCRTVRGKKEEERIGEGGGGSVERE
ncbi:hypothetical protein HAX54_002331 [Datura stramonium]|uniref:Uncharacterized protein n=1 Tax=Datura stramonium TaxID=4076 RepID=A0ABS8WR69_DATST|nr:hypothetical protein [Datura stramonium]